MSPATNGYVLVILVSLSLLVGAISQQSAYAESAISTIHSVSTGLEVADEMLSNGDMDGASYAVEFAAKQFALGLQPLRDIDKEVTDEIHITLLDMASTAKNSPSEQSTNTIRSALDEISMFDTSNENIRLAIVNMLTVAEEQYAESSSDSSGSSEVSYTISRTLFDKASEMFMDVSNPNVMLDLEQQSFFQDLNVAVEQKDSFVMVGTLVGAIQRDLLGTQTTAARDHSDYFDNIRFLYEQMRESLVDEDYTAAQEYAIEAYLENFEYLEPTLEAADAEFMYVLEVEMREDLRGMIRDEEPPEKILEFLDDVILPKLEKSEVIALEYLGADAFDSGTDGNGNVATAQESKKLNAMGDTTESEQSEVRNEVDFIRASMQEMLILYENGDYDSAYVTARTAYLDSYEYIEIPLRPIAPDFTLEVEYLFSELRSAIKEQAPIEEIREIAIQIERNLDESERLVSGTGQVAPLIAFSASFAIIFREGLEAVLILGAIMTYLEASRNARFKPYVHYGVIAAIGATAVTWFVASYVIEISGASRELIEAIAALSATAVLFYVSFWILNKIEHKKWMEFIKAKMWQATATGSVTVFMMLSFFTVYREGFETVLFYQAMFGFAKYMELYVGLGFVLGLGALIVVYLGMKAMGKRLPLRVLFGLTMGIGAYLSIAFLGNAIRELQVLDIVPYTSMMGTIPRLDINMATMTGIYPTLETVVAQIVLLCIYMTASVYILIVRPKREKEIAQMRKSRKE